MSARTNPPNTDFPLGCRVVFVDAWGDRPVEGRVTAHYGLDQIRVENADGIVFTGQTWRATALGGETMSIEDMLS